ncbi:MAG: hypothetical protein N2746_07675 [Deltaproteobacteria bacterium]|nr:hypothetical protein [Deltaproteobacteria bacterium]
MKKMLLSLLASLLFYYCSDSSNQSNIDTSRSNDTLGIWDIYYSDIHNNDVFDEVILYEDAEDIIYTDEKAGMDILADTEFSNKLDIGEEILIDGIDYDKADFGFDDSYSEIEDIYSGLVDLDYTDAIVSDTGFVDFGTKRGILFSAREKFNNKFSIFYVDPQGGYPKKISPDLPDEFKRPFWAPDGNSFYFESSGKIFKTVFGKFEPIEVCSGTDFAVSNDEKLIVLSKYVKVNDIGEYDYELFLYNLETKKYSQITTFMDGEMNNRPSSPSFSPDSKKILFSILNPTGSYDVYSSDLFIYDLETGFLVNITNEARKIQAKVANRSAEWSPISSRYAYLHVLFPESGYYLVDGISTRKRISEETHNGIDGIAFSPNANAIAIVTKQGKGINILDLNGIVLFELMIIDLEYIDNLSWR